ncbi:MAG TPA: hypothetical protein DEQ43_07520, partial [Nocardioides bacterium]|nr:hypothetical protein [Nocardioides sp.]
VYSLQSVDVSRFGGGLHTVTFQYHQVLPTTQADVMTVDDVGIWTEPLADPVSGAPDTSFTTVPGGTAKALSVPFAFTSTAVPATFQCSLDGAAYAACSSPTTLSVTPGPHVFRVRSTDAVGNQDA